MKFSVEREINGTKQQVEIDYELFVAGLGKKHKTLQEDYIHGAIGLAKEAGEMLDNAYRHWNYDKPRDAVTDENVLEEAGDILFYLQMMLNQTGHSLEDALKYNVNKLWARYEGTYSNAAALARKDKAGS